MSFYDDLRKKLEPELLASVLEKLGDDFNMDVVPRTRLNEVIGQRAQANSTVANLQEQLATLQASMADKKVDVDALKAEWEATKATELNAIKLQYAGLDMLRTAGVIDPEVAFSLIDATKLSIGADGKLTGLDDQLETLKTNKSYLFGQTGGRGDTGGGTGRNGGGDDGFSAVSTLKDFMALGSAKQMEFKQAHPAKFREFYSQV